MDGLNQVWLNLERQVQVAFPKLALEDQDLPSVSEQEVTQRPAQSENQCEEQRELIKKFNAFSTSFNKRTSIEKRDFF